MKKLLMIVAMMVATLSANAQNEVGQVTLKPMVGMTLATITDFDNVKMKAGLVAGVEAEYGISEKAKEGDGKMKLDYINVPILANYYVIPGLAIKAGIQPGFLMSAKDNDGNSFKDEMKKVDISIPLGASYEFENFVIDARYNLGLTKGNKNGDKSRKNSVLMFTVGYKFAL